jgi:hypothetical protein
MLRFTLLIAVILFIGLSSEIYAQDARTQQLVSALDKTKYKKKEKRNISIEFYIDIKNEAAVRTPSDLAGSYESEDRSNSLSLQVDGNGAARGSGYDNLRDHRANFTLKDASITGALLTATKVYENGEQRPFEAVFVNRTVRTGKNSESIVSEDTKFGLGFVETHSSSDGAGNTENWTNRVFLMRR